MNIDFSLIPIPSVVMAYKQGFQCLIESKGEGYWLDNMPKGLFPVNRGDLTSSEIHQLVDVLCRGTGVQPPRTHDNNRLRQKILQIRNKTHLDKIHRFVRNQWTATEDVDFRSIFAIVQLDRLANQLQHIIQNDSTSNYEYPFPIYTRGFNGYMPNKDFITIFDALAVKHWTDSNLTGFLKTDTMAATLQATNAKFEEIQGIDIRVQRRGTFLYSCERSMLLVHFNAPHLLWVNITRRHRAPTRHRGKVGFTLHQEDIQWNQEENSETVDDDRNDDTAGGRGSRDEAVDDDRNDDTARRSGSRDEAADGENEGHGADANSDRDQNARDTHNSNDAHEVRGAYDSMPSKEEILSLADGSSLSGAREKASQEEIMRDKYAIIDHISLETCCGQKHNFHEAKHINTRFRQS